MLVKNVPRSMKDLEALKRLVEGEVTTRRRLISMRQSVPYLMVDASGMGFGSVMWSQSFLVLEAGKSAPLYQGRSSNFIEGGEIEGTDREKRGTGGVEECGALCLH